MSKTKEHPNIDFELAGIEPAGFSLAIPDGVKITGDFQFRISLESIIRTETKMLVVTNRVDIRTGSDGGIIGHFVARYLFGLTGIEHIKKNKKGVHMVPKAIQLAVNTIALSTTRGLMFAQFRGTALHGGLLPLIDVSNFSTNEAEE